MTLSSSFGRKDVGFRVKCPFLILVLRKGRIPLRSLVEPGTQNVGMISLQTTVTPSPSYEDVFWLGSCSVKVTVNLRHVLITLSRWDLRIDVFRTDSYFDLVLLSLGEGPCRNMATPSPSFSHPSLRETSCPHVFTDFRLSPRFCYFLWEVVGQKIGSLMFHHHRVDDFLKLRTPRDFRCLLSVMGLG